MANRAEIRVEDAEEVQTGPHQVLHEEDQDLNRTTGRHLTPRDTRPRLQII